MEAHIAEAKSHFLRPAVVDMKAEEAPFLQPPVVDLKVEVEVDRACSSKTNYCAECTARAEREPDAVCALPSTVDDCTSHRRASHPNLPSEQGNNSVSYFSTNPAL